MAETSTPADLSTVYEVWEACLKQQAKPYIDPKVIPQCMVTGLIALQETGFPDEAVTNTLGALLAMRRHLDSISAAP